MQNSIMIFGTFDILHLGHIDFFKQAKQHGNFLSVVLATDERVAEIKGTPPMHTQAERKQMLEAMRDIDAVILGDSTDVYRAIKERRPEVIALGYDQRHFVDKLEQVLKDECLEKTRIVRLLPYKPEHHKSGKIRDYVEKQI